MKLFTTSLFTMILVSGFHVVAQTNEPRHMVLVHEDNDFLNLIGNRTDRSYTNGSRIDFFRTSRLQRHSFLYKILPTAGDSSINFSGWSLAQLMVTPNDISKKEYQPDDYPYAGSLFVTHSFHSYNPVKKFRYHSELLVGIRGRHAMAKQTQTAIHALINSGKPRGWDNQLDTQPLFNLTFTGEKNLFSWHRVVELNGGIQTRIGSLMDGINVYSMVRIGKMSPYFDGVLSQYGSYTQHGKNKRMQYYLVIKPTASFVAYNAMLKGPYGNAEKGKDGGYSSASVARYVGDIQFGAVIAYGNMGISYLLTRSSAYEKGLYEHRFGTVEIYIRW